MAKEKRLITFNDVHYKMMSDMMTEDGTESISYFLGTLISDRYKERHEAKNKRKQGRPRKNEEDDTDEEDYADDLPKNIPYYGTMIGKREYDDKLALQASFKPQG